LDFGLTKSEDGVRRNALPAWATPIITDHLREFVGPGPDDLGVLGLGRFERPTAELWHSIPLAMPDCAI